MKICFTASSGGHLTEISQLERFMRDYDSILVTEKNQFQKIPPCNSQYFMPQINRKEKLFVFKFLWIAMKSLYIIWRERPDVFISTGALMTFPICLIAKKLGKKVIYIESFARIHTLSVTGRFMYKIADLFIVQSKELSVKYPKAVYGGIIFNF